MSAWKATGIGGRILFGAAVLATAYRLAFIALSTSTEGTITELSPQEADEEETVTFLPKFQFSTISGRVIEKDANVASFPAKVRPGDPVDVRYLKFAPEWTVIDRFLYLWFLPIFFFGMASIFGLISLAIPFFQREKLVE
ncbi:MAG: hypothetical protein ACJAQT_003054 [Akkermansiaceae bacterium]|jgi:hypothetical protein